MRKLKLIHMDNSGPYRMPSLKIAQVFWKFKARVENKNSCEIHIVRSHNEKEYT